MKKTFYIFLLSLICFLSQIAYSQDTPKPDSAGTVTLKPGNAVEGKLESYLKTQNYQIRLSEGQHAKIVVEQIDVDVTVKLFGADGNFIIRSNDELRLKKDEIIEIVAAATGNYRIEIQTNSKNAAGIYKIQFEDVGEATARDRGFFEAHTLVWQADALNESDKFVEALKLAARALEIAEKQLGADDALVGRILSEMGSSQTANRKYPEALPLLERAFAVSEKSLGAEHPQTLACLFKLGIYYYSTGDYPKAARNYRQALTGYERVLGADNFTVGIVSSSFGNLLNLLGDSEQGEKYLERARVIIEKYSGAESSSVARILSRLGAIYLDRRENDRAASYLQKALEIYEKNGDVKSTGYSSVLVNLGIVYHRQKLFQKTLEIYNRALLIEEKRSGGKETSAYATILGNIANIYSELGDIAKALEMQQRVRDIAEKSGGLYHSATLLSIDNISKYYAAQGNTAGALEYQKLWDERFEKVLALNLTIGSERQKLAYTGDGLVNRTSRTISLHLDQARDNQKALDMAALVVLQRKGRVLDAVADNVASLRRRASKDDLVLLDRLNEQATNLAKLTLNKPAKMPFDEYQKQTADLEAEKEKLEREINDRSAEFSVQSPTVTLEAIKAEIPDDAALIEFAVYRPWNPKAEVGVIAYGEPRYIAYILRRQGNVKYAELGDKKTIDSAVDEWRKALRDPKRGDVRDLSRASDEKVMQPIRALLGDAKQLLISPDGELNLMPFEALADENNRYLIEKYSFTYLTSGRDLLRMKKTVASKSESLLIANPQFGASVAENTSVAGQKRKAGGKRKSVTATRNLSDTYFTPLGGTTQEARVIQTLFPEARFLSGAQATETALKQTNAPRILHIATHGFFLEDANAVANSTDDSTAARRGAKTDDAPENPLLRSGLALAGANRRDANGTGDDGILTALEASGLNLRGTKLVVLSACDTGLGEVKNGEGVYGLRRSFFLAGAESLVMSLWAVSDSVTRELMTNYYKNLKNGMGRGAALREVQLKMLKQTDRAHPFYWAGFIQSGEWANLDGKR